MIGFADVAPYIFPSVFAGGTVFAILNGTREAVKETRIDVKSMLATQGEHGERLAAVETTTEFLREMAAKE